jgi:putative transcriptional regulator
MGSLSFALDWQPYIKVNVPSYRFADVVIATAGSVSGRSWSLDMKNRIRVLRAEKGWSQAELAEKVGVSRNPINAVENGKFDPSLPLAFRIVELFELKIEDVFLRRG